METHDQPTANGTSSTASTVPPTPAPPANDTAAPTVVSATPNGIGPGIEIIPPYFKGLYE